MALNSLPRRTLLFKTLLHHHRPLFSSPEPSPSVINDLCRVLSDHRALHHDLEPALSRFSPHLSPSLIHQTLKRTSHLPLASHRFFLWAHSHSHSPPSFPSLSLLLHILASSRQFPLAWDLLSHTKHTHPLQLSADLFRLLSRLYAKSNSPADAVRTFNKMPDFNLTPSLDDLDHLLYVLCKKRFVANAHEFFDTVKHSFPARAKSYTILIRGWGDAGDSARARKVFDEMLERGCAADVAAYNSLLEALCKGGDSGEGGVEEAYRWFRRMKGEGVEPDACTYSVFIRAYCAESNVFSAFRVLDRMKRYSLVPNVFTYNCVIKRLCAEERVEEAYRVLDEMVGGGVCPDTWSYNTVMVYHCNRCEVNRACNLVCKMERDGCMPDRHTYNMLLKMLIRVGRFDRVKEVWDGMGGRGFYPPVSTYAVMIHGLLKKNRKVEEACKYFEVMIDEGIPPYSTTWGLLRNRLVGLGLLDLKDVLADKMERSSSCSIQELSEPMRGVKGRRRMKREDDSDQSEEDWVLGWEP